MPLVALLVCVVVAGVLPPAASQELVPGEVLGGGKEVSEKEKRQNTVYEFEPLTERFQQATAALRDHVKKLREVVIRFNVASAEENRRWQDRFQELIDEGVGIHQEFLQAAIEEYRQGLENKEPLGNMLFKILERNIDRDRFDGMVELAQALLDGGYQHEDLEGYLVMAAYGLCRFDIVEPHLEQLIARGVVSDRFLHVHANLEQIKQDWAEELEYRRQDAQGEPLPRALLRTTKGDIEVELFENQAPETVANFIHLAESGFYDHHLFHRVIPHFMAQTGDPLGDGTGGPGYAIYDEHHRPDHRKFFRGYLGMARTAAPNSAGSQFFITFLPTFDLNGQYTVFGRVVKGIEVLSNLRRVDPDSKTDSEEDKGLPLDELIEVRILSKRNHPYEPHKVEG
ncbi:MAG: peptidyl-prolyl cis-trans isomerase [Pirellulaceae bacterium]|nr:MAG: peptidyl-prolyl cis-trans isomerase [Pirellulaceae bacterium]